jgi:hypothetical protein
MSYRLYDTAVFFILGFVLRLYVSVLPAHVLPANVLFAQRINGATT